MKNFNCCGWSVRVESFCELKLSVQRLIANFELDFDIDFMCLGVALIHIASDTSTSRRVF